MIRSLIIRASHLPGIATVWRPFLNYRATIFLLHRFHDREIGSFGHDRAALRNLLVFLRRERFDILPLTEMVSRIQESEPSIRGAVAFTIDDGYLDTAVVAAPLFAEFDCPATTFVTTGFLDGQLWPWWDKIDFIFQNTKRRQLSLVLRSETLSYSLDNDIDRKLAQEDFDARCKLAEDGEKHALILALAQVAEVDLPDATPPQYAPMSWEQLRNCEKQGMRFGPHTVTHPILSRVSAEQSRWEIKESWDRVRTEAREPVPVFAYPNGFPEDFGEREIATVREMEMLGGVVVKPGAHIRVPLHSEAKRFRIPRMPFPDGGVQSLQYASGFERFKQIMRRKTY